MKKTSKWGVELTSLEDMAFSKYLENSELPRPNTVSQNQRVDMLIKFLDEYRAKKIRH